MERTEHTLDVPSFDSLSGDSTNPEAQVATLSAVLLELRTPGLEPLAEPLRSAPDGSRALGLALLALEHGLCRIESCGGVLLSRSPEGFVVAFAPGGATGAHRAVQIARELLVEPELARVKACAAVALGTLYLHRVGGGTDGWQTIVAGPALDDLRALHIEAGRVEMTSTVEAALRRLPTIAPEPRRPVEARPAPRPRCSGATVLRLRVPGMGSSPNDLAKLHAAVLLFQATVRRHGGRVERITARRDGVYMSSSFSLRPGGNQHTGRSILAAQEACAGLRELDLTPHCGLASGRVFQCEGWLIGPATRRADALASADGVLVDGRTAMTARRSLRFSEGPELQIDDNPVPTFRPAARTVEEDGRQIGRDIELGRVVSRLRRFLVGGPGGTVVLSGEAGIGKSTLLAVLKERAILLGARCIEGQAHPLERHTSWYGFRRVYETLLGVDRLTRREIRLELEQLAPRLRRLLPLLEAIVPLGFRETAHTEQLLGAARWENTVRLLSALLVRATREEPIVLLFEDAHWMDSASRALLNDISSRIPRLLIVLTSRPCSDDLPEGSEVVHLEGLDRADLRELLRRRLGVRDVAAAVTELFAGQADGNPFHAEQLAMAMVESGQILIEDDRARLDPAHEWDALVPSTVGVVIRDRIAHLPLDARETLLVASVLGPVFDQDELSGLHPRRLTNHALHQVLNRLAQHDLLVWGGDGSWAFRHELTQRAAYELLSAAERRDYHRNAALHIEWAAGDDASRVYARLARHWGEAGDRGREIECLGRAGAIAQKQAANVDAVRLLRRALEADVALRGPLRFDATRANWELQLGEAYYGLSNHTDAVDAFGRALGHVGVKAPTGGLGLLAEFGRNLLSRIREPAVCDNALEREEARLAMRAMANLQASQSFLGDLGAATHTALLARRIAIRGGTSPEAAHAHASGGIVVAIFGLERLALRDLKRGVTMAERLGALLPMASTNVLLGMTLNMRDRPAEAAAAHGRAIPAADRLGHSLWRHRSRFMRALALMRLDQHNEAARLFRRAGELARAAEPAVTGFARCARAACLARLGRGEEALEQIDGDDGLDLVRGDPTATALFVSLGARAHALASLGRTEELPAAIEAALPHALDGHTFFASLVGYEGLGAALRALKASGDRSGRTRRLWVRTVARFAAFAMLYPGAREAFRSLVRDGLR